MENLFGIFEIGVGVYLLYGAISGKGQMFQTENIKKDKVEAYKKAVRRVSFILGPLMVIMGAVDVAYTANPLPALRIALYTLLGLTFAGVVTLVVIALRMTDRTKKASDKPEKSSVPNAAFDFDEANEKKPGEK